MERTKTTDDKYYVGLDLGASSVKYALVRGDGFITFRKQRPSLALGTQAEVLGNLAAAVRELVEMGAADGIAPTGIGVGSPGAIDSASGKVIGVAPNIPDWLGADIKGYLEAEIGLPTMADNDANITVLAEARLGAGKDVPDLHSVIAITLGTGIGAGIMIDGGVLHGHGQSASEIGHTILYPDGILCDCGSRGCFEKYVAAPAVVRRVRELLARRPAAVLARLTGGDENGLNPKVIFQAAAEGCQVCREVIDGVTHDLGIGVASVASIINPQMIIIGGGMADAGPEFIEGIAAAIKRNALKAITQNLIVRRATLGNDAGVVGAMLIIKEHLQRVR